MQRTISIERRLQLAIGVSTAAFTLLFILLGGYLVHQVSVDYILSRLEHDAESLLAATQPNGNDQQPVRSDRITPVYLQPYSGHYYLVQVADRPIELSRSLWDFQLELPLLAAGERDVREVTGPDGQLLLQLSLGYARADVPVLISVAEDISDLEQRIASYQRGFGAVALILLLFFLWLLRFWLRRGFLPLERLREDVRLVALGEQAEVAREVPSEIRPLAEELNRLLALLGDRLTRSRHALGNLAHALKAPLNLIGQELQASDFSTDQRQRLTQKLERIRQLTERELRRAKLAGAGSPGQHFMPTQEVPDLLRVMHSLYRDKSLSFDVVELPPQRLPIDREDMLELLGNLLDNACKWANQRVRLCIRQQQQVLWVEIADDEPGVDRTQLQRLAQRGVRIDEERDGHGLGLAIVQDMTKLYRGKVQFSIDPSLGGLRVDVCLPGNSDDRPKME